MSFFNRKQAVVMMNALSCNFFGPKCCCWNQPALLPVLLRSHHHCLHYSSPIITACITSAPSSLPALLRSHHHCPQNPFCNQTNIGRLNITGISGKEIFARERWCGNANTRVLHNFIEMLPTLMELAYSGHKLAS